MHDLVLLLALLGRVVLAPGVPGNLHLNATALVSASSWEMGVDPSNVAGGGSFPL